MILPLASRDMPSGDGSASFPSLLVPRKKKQLYKHLTLLIKLTRLQRKL